MIAGDADWPLPLEIPRGTVTLPGPGNYRLDPPLLDMQVDGLLDAARAQLGATAVGWMPADGGLLGNLPAWENLLLSCQWHAPAALPALEARLTTWLPQLGYGDLASARRLLAYAPSRLSPEHGVLVGWLRLLLVRPRLVLLSGQALPEGETGRQLAALVDEELANCARLVIDGAAPADYLPLPLVAREASKS